ncbi:MFS transporter [Chloroflexota bacterium]
MPENQVTKVDRIRPGQPDVEYTARKALKTQAFWLLMLAAGIGWMGLSAMLVHIMPCLESVGISRGTAGLVVTSLAVFNIISRFGFGWLGDRFDKGKLLAITLALEATGLLIFAYARTVLGLIPFLLTFGPSWGGQGVLLFTIQREYFGRSAYGSIRGLLITGSVVTSIAVPPIVGWVFDVRGSYLLAWLVLSVISAITVPFILNIKPPVKGLAKTESC